MGTVEGKVVEWLRMKGIRRQEGYADVLFFEPYDELLANIQASPEARELSLKRYAAYWALKTDGRNFFHRKRSNTGGNY